jgi:hypothetical protein
MIKAIKYNNMITIPKISNNTEKNSIIFKIIIKILKKNRKMSKSYKK